MAGGGRSFNIGENDECGLSKPFELSWPLTPSSLVELNNLLDTQSKCATRVINRVATLETAPAPSAGSFLTKTVSITNAELAAMSVTPKVLLAAPGAGILIVPIQAVVASLATVGYSNNPQLRFLYTGSASTFFGSATPPRLDLLTPQLTQFLPQAGQYTNTSLTNKGLEVSFNLALTGAGTATMEVFLTYALFTNTLN